MTLDTIERVKYFGLRSKRSCGFCRFRNGHSAARRGTRHDPALLDLLLGWATRETHSQVQISQRARAREKLLRHGWQYKNRCHLTKYAKHCLVRVEKMPSAPYFGLCHFERMHVFFINYCKYCMDLLVECVRPRYEQRVHELMQGCHQFRDPVSGRAHPRLVSLMDTSHLTAEKRVRSIFYWGHVLGTEAEVIVEQVRRPAQVAVSCLQLLLIATRGHRAYSVEELHEIFEGAGKYFFRALEMMAVHVEDGRMTTGQLSHARRPTAVRPPLPFKRQRRCVATNPYSCACTHIRILCKSIFGRIHTYPYFISIHICVHTPISVFCVNPNPNPADMNRTQTQAVRPVRTRGEVMASSNIPQKACLTHCFIPPNL